LCKAFLSVGKYEKKEKFEDIKGGNQKLWIEDGQTSKTDRQYNCHDKKDKTTTHDLQNTTQKTKNWITGTRLKTGMYSVATEG
jgi:hypothetical protein